MWLEIDANLVRPGWTPLLITIALGIVLALLGLSMRRQMRRISPDLPYEADLRREDGTSPTSPISPVSPVEERDVTPTAGSDPTDATVDLRRRPGTPG